MIACCSTSCVRPGAGEKLWRGFRERIRIAHHPTFEAVQRDAITLAEDWKKSRREPAGRRFHTLHVLRRRKDSSRPIWLRTAHFLVGGALLGLAVFFTFIPGPNWLFFIPGATLLATESGLVARFLDVAEQAATPLIRKFKKHWSRLGATGKTILMIAFFGLALGCAYLVFA